MKTEDLISELSIIVREANSKEEFKYYKDNESIENAIATRLRAADKLCKEAEDVVQLARAAMTESNLEAAEYDIEGELQDICQAIVEYEGRRN